MEFKNLFILSAILFFTNNFYSQVGIGTTNPSSVARMEVSSQTDGVGNYRGFLMPRVPTLVARDQIAVTSTDNGLLVYVEEVDCLQLWDGFKWVDVSCVSSVTAGTASQDFEVTPGTPELPIFRVTGGDYTTGTGDYPNTSLFVSGSRGYGINSGTTTLILGPLNVSASTDATFKLRLGGFALTAGNGMDVTDTVKISISTTGTGGTFSEELLILGGAANDSNNTWGFDATRTATVVYDGDGTPTSFTSGTGNDGTTGGISFLEITGIPNSANLAVKIVLLNNKSNEQWVIDDAEIIGN